MSFLVNAAGGRDNAINAYLFTQAQYDTWAAGTTGAPATAVWLGLTTGTSAGGSYTATTAGVYELVLHNVATDGTARSVLWTRSNTQQDVATDALRAVYAELQTRGFNYTNVPSDYFGALGQHVRLPAESLAGGTANCIDGSVLFASLLELVGMEPVMFVVLRPTGGGHAYVGVKARPPTYDPNNPAMRAAPARIWSVETTMLGTDTFESAAYTAETERGSDLQNYLRDPTHADYYEVDVIGQRARGITPIP